jgi:hypothetical protein
MGDIFAGDLFFVVNGIKGHYRVSRDILERVQ